MKKVRINSKHFESKDELHEYLKKELDFPEYYGKNLAALYDCLGDISEMTEIHFKMKKFQSEQMEMYLRKVRCVFQDGAEENDNLIITE